MRTIKHNILRLLVFTFILAIAQSCEWEQREPIDESDLPEVVSFYDHIVPIFEAKCTQCHNGTTPPNLTYDNAYLELTAGGYINTDNPTESKLYKSIDIGGSMYQYASDLDRAYILKWIEQGADEN